jgi:ketosteroid isomerase-like protein
MLRSLRWGAVALATLVTSAQRPAPDEPAVRAAEAARFTAMTRGDGVALDRLLAPELTHVHTSGATDTKATLLAALQSRALLYDAIAPESVAVRIYGATAVATGRSQMHVRTRGRPLTFGIRFTEVYVKRDGTWWLVAWQSTRLP